ncbi:MAG: hypothetical protein KF709_04595 [Gemmatimonadaceae bacterium]|nr:hypothetical protein [Gemmatimonadaceae bacterium]
MRYALASLLVGVLGCLPLGLPDPKIPRAVGDRAVLFIGNSHTYVNDLPGMVRWMARQVGDTGLRTGEVSAPNFALEDHLAIGQAAKALQDSRWKWVVLQQGTSALPESQANLEYYTRIFGPAIREAGADPVLYQIWPFASRRFDADAALTSYWNAAFAVQGILAPAGDAFTAALESDPPINVYHDDGLHASPLGTYLAAAVIYARLAGVSPESLPATFPSGSVDSATVRALQRAASTALARSPARPTARRVVKDTTAGLRDSLSAPRLVIDDTTFFPEGLDVDPRDGTMYVTSIRHRTVYRVRPGAAAEPVLASGAEGLGAAMGVRLDVRRNLLWVTAADLPYMRRDGLPPTPGAELVAFDLASGRVAQRHLLGDGSGAPGELALASDGTVLVSDGLRAQLYRLRPGARAIEVLRPEGLRSPQGIAVSPDAAVAWVADWSRGLFRWDLRSDVVAPVTTAAGGRIGGMDGLLRAADGSLVAVQNGGSRPRVLQLLLNATGDGLEDVRVLEERDAYEGEPTVGALLGDRYFFVSSSAWPFWDEQGGRKSERGPLPQVILRELALPKQR